MKVIFKNKEILPISNVISVKPAGDTLILLTDRNINYYPKYWEIELITGREELI